MRKILDKDVLDAIVIDSFEQHVAYTDQPATPFEAVIQMVNNLDIDGKNIVTVNPDIFIALTILRDESVIYTNTITLVTDIEALQGKPNVIYIN